MICHLIRRDPAWKIMPWLALLSAAWAYMPTSRLAVWIGIAAFFGGMPQRRASRLEAGLPIKARDLLLARALSLMAALWIPALSGAAAIAAVKGSAALLEQPLAAAALLTLAAGVAQAAWRKEVEGPKWLLVLGFVGMPAAGMLTVGHALALGLTICTLAGVGLFAWAWVKAPKSFQLAGAGVKADEADGANTPASRAPFRWAPVLRSVYSWQYAFLMLFMGMWAATGTWELLPFWLIIVWQPVRPKTRWLWALPVGRRALLWTIIGPIIAVHALGYLAFARPFSQPRVIVVTLAAILGYLLLTILFCALFDWRGFARIPRRSLRIAFFSIFAIWYAGSMEQLFFGPHSSKWLPDAVVQFARTAPLSLPALIAAAAAVLLALYWAVEKVFSEPDFADQPKAAQPDAFN